MNKQSVIKNKIESLQNCINHIEIGYQTLSNLSGFNLICGYDEEHERLVQMFRRFYSNYADNLTTENSREIQ